MYLISGCFSHRKIELITSYGPTSDDEDSDKETTVSKQSSKKKNTDHSKPSSKKPAKEVISIGPQLPPGYVLPEEQKQTEVKPVIKEDKTNNHQPLAVQKPQSKIPTVTLEADVVIVEKDVPANTQNDVQKISALQR